MRCLEATLHLWRRLAVVVGGSGGDAAGHPSSGASAIDAAAGAVAVWSSGFRLHHGDSTELC